MRPSLGGSGGVGGGNGGVGGGMLRSVQRVLRASGGEAAPEPFSSSTTSNNATASSRKAKQFNEPQTNLPNTALTLSSNNNNPNNNGPSAFSTLINLPSAPGAAASAWGSCSDGDVDWECVDVNQELDDQKAVVFSEGFVFATVPSSDEVNYAISAIKQVLEPSLDAPTEDICKDVENEDDKTEVVENINSSSSESEVDWIEPLLNYRSSRMLHPCGSDRVYDAFNLLQSEPAVQRMVFALSSDKAVWDAVLNNDVVKELRGSFNQGDEQGNSTDGEASDDDNNPVKDILSWVFVNTKVKLMQLIDKITKLVNEIFQSEERKGGKIDPFHEKLKTSLFLSIIVLLIVVVTRAKSS